jgi:uncharacterized protein (TIGR00251 family)
VKPGSRVIKIEALSQDQWSGKSPEYTVRLHAKAEGGKANKELAEVLAKHFKVPKSAVEILRGETARVKLVEIA